LAVRGGSWNNNAQNVRSANRNRNTATNRNNNLGFRLAQSGRCLYQVNQNCPVYGQGKRVGDCP